MTVAQGPAGQLPPRFDFDTTSPDPIPEAGIARANELMRSGRLFRYTEVAEGEVNDAAEIEVRFAELLGRRYAVAVNSCGGALFVALRACGIGPGDKVLMNGYTLAPAPGAVHHAGAELVLVEITDRLTIDLEDLRRKADASGAKTLLLSHMRGHFADLEAVSSLCDELGITLIEDCAHTLGARWNGRPTGTFGKVGCFSAQTFKHINSGEGGFVVTDDDEVAARAILHSGSYMLYEQHRARPPMSAFEPLRGRIANYSLRMSALEAAVATPQLELLPERVEKMNVLYQELERLFREIPEVRVIERAPHEEYVGSSFQFSFPDLTSEQISAVVRTAAEHGLHAKWFGNPRMQGFTSRPGQWEYVAPDQWLPRTEAILAKLCDIRVPAAMQLSHCRAAADVIRFAVAESVPAS
jgi:dTDP-4-amino-4,6-dideoxygalactose transaminase